MTNKDDAMYQSAIERFISWYDVHGQRTQKDDVEAGAIIIRAEIQPTVEGLRARLAELRALNTELAEHLEQSKHSALDSAKVELELRAEIEHLRSELTDAETDFSVASQNLGKRDAEIERLKESFATLGSKWAETCASHVKLQAENAALTERLAADNNAIEQNIVEIQRLVDVNVQREDQLARAGLLERRKFNAPTQVGHIFDSASGHAYQDTDGIWQVDRRHAALIEAGRKAVERAT